MTKLNKHLLITAVALSALSGNAREKYGNVFRNAAPQKVMAGCSPAQASAELSINNVRTIIYSGSDMWWDLFGSGNARYAVPKVEDVTKAQNSNFCGNIWFGGVDVGGQLKIAAQTYRQGGVDFWTGPLTTGDATVNSDVCQQYDKIFKLNRVEVDAFVLADGPITNNIKNWPGNGDISMNQDQQLAPFVDIDGDAIYSPEAGDYPYYDVYNVGAKDNLGVCKARVFGDETLWWVYNDNGSNHVATGGKAIGMEIRAQAFAFKTTDEINNMTFYGYQLINRSTFALYDTYMTVWTDADLGYYGDDYIGCDVQRGLGYIYNADGNDETVAGTPGYGVFCPALGCDFFQGPINTANGIDDDHDNGLAIPGQLTGIDEPGEQMGMTIFNYHNNSFPGVPLQTTDPQNSTQYYQYMTGFWRDGTPFTCGGNGYGGTIPTNYVYPADTYTAGPCGNWSESTSPGDRRFMQSSGPFILQPGAVNYITVGIPWARTTSTDPKASIPLLKVADDKAQALFDNCFRVLSGPEAPDMTIQEMENELIIYFSNKPSSNNYLNQYKELDVTIQADPTHFPSLDKYYHFEGYKLYQLKNNTIIQEELSDPSKAKLIFNCDLENGISRLVNYEYDANSGGDVPSVKIEKTETSDKGIKSTFHFTQDAFALTSDKKVINHKEYYFFCVAYGYNEYGVYKEDQVFTVIDPVTGIPPASSEGQKRPYLEGRKSKKAYGIPHNPAPEKDGSITNSLYGYGPKVTRLEGQGNGGNNLELTQSSIEAIVANGDRVDEITYENGRGPVNIKVVDPLNVPNSVFTIALINRNYFYRSPSDTALSPTALNQYINDVINADPCKTSTVSIGGLPPHSTLPFYKLKNSNMIFGTVDKDTATWVLKDTRSAKEYYPCKSIKIGEEYYFNELGLSVTIGGTNDIAAINFPFDNTKDKIIKDGDIISGSVGYTNSGSNWLSGVTDRDASATDGFNWIRSGSYKNEDDAALNDYETNNGGAASNIIFADEKQYFENVINGTWAPYALTATSKPSNPAAPGYPGITTTAGILLNTFDLRTLASVDIVFTKDKSKWTRCIILEENDEPASIPTKANKLETKRRKSVDKQGIGLGDPGCNTSEAYLDSSGTEPFYTGLGWFPGYAINLETGERLNIAFGEDSYQINNNGDDMMWNPTNSVSEQTYRYAFGGRHYIYVFGNNRGGSIYAAGTGATAFVPPAINGRLIGSGTYADFKNLAYMYKWAYNNTITGTPSQKASGNVALTNIWTDAMWANIPVTIDARYNFKKPEDMPSDAKVSLRVKKAYRPSLSAHAFVNASNYTQAGYVNPSTALNINLAPTILPNFPYSAINSNSYTAASRDTLLNSNNNNYNLYRFSTEDVFTEINNSEKHKSALDIINIVPNPYYAYSTYEQNRIDNRVRITNLPNKCKIKIFTLNGTLVRTFDRDVSGQEDITETKQGSDFVHSKRLPFQDWDMKNQSGIPVASGLYIIHIDVPGVGEKILKWFGVMRPLDLQSY
ncbi:MAG: hypothetical protein V4580_04640 [Bacteroidota bacterium]